VLNVEEVEYILRKVYFSITRLFNGEMKFIDYRNIITDFDVETMKIPVIN
jgi:hypothetical protein